MKVQERIECHDIEKIITARFEYYAVENQYWCRTPKTWELWQKEPLMLIKRVPRRYVLWSVPKKEED